MDDGWISEIFYRNEFEGHETIDGLIQTNNTYMINSWI